MKRPTFPILPICAAALPWGAVRVWACQAAVPVENPGEVDWRKAMARHGIGVHVCLTAETWCNTTGGADTGCLDTEALHFQVDVDLEKALGWHGATFGMCWLGLHGDDLGAEKTGSLLTVSNIAAYNTVRLYDCWIEQTLLDDRLSLRFGQISADSEFLVSEHAGLFLNGTFGWPALAYLNLPDGGPGFPVATPGLRVAWNPSGNPGFQAAVYQGNVFSQEGNPHGFRWHPGAETGCTGFVETTVGWKLGNLRGSAKLGGWIQSGDNADTVAGTADSNGGGYLVVDQVLFEESGGPDQGLSAFLRAGGASADRNFVDFYTDCGLVYQGPFPGRDTDQLGLAFAYARVSAAGRGLTAANGANPAAMETAIELSYQIQISESFRVQPDLQYIIHPGGTRDTRDALVTGLRATLMF